MVPAVQQLTSSRNPLLKDIRRAAGRGALTEAGFCVAEGIHLLEEARRSHCEIGAVLASEYSAGKASGFEPLFILPAALFEEIATTEATQGVIALVRPPRFELSAMREGPILLLDGIQDPGNAGAIVRAAEAFGAAGAVFLKTTVSPYNPKCLRGSAGSLFRFPFVSGISDDAVRRELAGVPMFAAEAHAALTIEDVHWPVRAGIVIGSEGRGVSAEWNARATAVRIPISGVESLNAAVAAAVILYEIRRQRKV
jgi:RNA methyltransferase, TrmH family